MRSCLLPKKMHYLFAKVKKTEMLTAGREPVCSVEAKVGYGVVKIFFYLASQLFMIVEFFFIPQFLQELYPEGQAVEIVGKTNDVGFGMGLLLSESGSDSDVSQGGFPRFLDFCSG